MLPSNVMMETPSQMMAVPLHAQFNLASAAMTSMLTAQTPIQLVSTHQRYHLLMYGLENTREITLLNFSLN